MSGEPVTEIEGFVLDFVRNHPCAGFSEIRAHCSRRFVDEVQRHANGWRRVDRALQRLRKRGEIVWHAQTGWRAVEAK